MNGIPEPTSSLKRLRLSGIVDTLQARNREAIDRKLAYSDFLKLVIEDDIARRDHRELGARMRRANFRCQKTPEGFDFERLRNHNRAAVDDLATCGFIDENLTVRIAGPATGKSNLAQALGHAAARQGHDVLFMTRPACGRAAQRTGCRFREGARQGVTALRCITAG
ncbi:ATP-binding protein [Paraburkholderia strydomiana]|uniref:ATP-binding protein n=1 Tax=Paraburkholderia strydomiana TaxID=1245417 RepID=UPI002034F570|nr:ATP-binding protein [Paraburkholderia strydomiana]